MEEDQPQQNQDEFNYEDEQFEDDQFFEMIENQVKKLKKVLGLVLSIKFIANFFSLAISGKLHCTEQ